MDVVKQWIGHTQEAWVSSFANDNNIVLSGKPNDIHIHLDLMITSVHNFSDFFLQVIWLNAEARIA